MINSLNRRPEQNLLELRQEPEGEMETLLKSPDFWDETDWDKFDGFNAQAQAEEERRAWEAHEFKLIEAKRDIAIATRAELEMDGIITSEKENAWIDREQTNFEAQGLSLEKSVAIAWETQEKNKESLEKEPQPNLEADLVEFSEEPWSPVEQSDANEINISRPRREADRGKRIEWRVKEEIAQTIRLIEFRIRRISREIANAPSGKTSRLMVERDFLQRKIAGLNLPKKMEDHSPNELKADAVEVVAQNGLSNSERTFRRTQAPASGGSKIIRANESNITQPNLNSARSPIPEVMRGNSFFGQRSL